MARPVGVTILSILDFLGAAALLLFAILCFVGGGFLATVGQSDQAQGLGALLGMGAAVIGVVMLVIAIICALIGWGMWKVKNWARILTIVLCALGVLFRLWGLVHMFSISSIIVIAIDALIIWYLLKADVKAAFA
jgi:hypothetical protein